MLAYSPLARGALTSRPMLGGKRPAETLERIAGETGKPKAQVALNWVISKPEVTGAISGSDTIEQLDDNLGAVGWALSEEEMARLDEVSAGSKMEFSNLETVENPRLHSGRVATSR